MEQASDYLLAAYRQAGYVTEVQTFTYSKFEDYGSTLTLGNTTLAGRALNNSVAGNLTARLVAVPNVGRTEDFAQVDVQGAIAIVRRGEIRFSEKANNAAAAGAIGLVVVNTESGNFPGAIDGETSIPVLSLSSEQGRPLLEQAVPEPVTLNVNTANRTVTGRNIIAHLAVSPSQRLCWALITIRSLALPVQTTMLLVQPLSSPLPAMRQTTRSPVKLGLWPLMAKKTGYMALAPLYAKLIRNFWQDLREC